ncbi:MAG: hypothetical protein FH751_14340 [Firmicutes bacterium]|nr:hypothetical protein [Bacillota bacterium]
MKKILSTFLVFLLLLSFGGISFANSINLNDLNNDDYKFVKYQEPVDFLYDGKTVKLLGYYEINNLEKEITNSKEYTLYGRAYYEYDRWYVYDHGIVDTWSWLSKPYFVKSIARGETYTKEEDVQVTIKASVSGDYPSESKSAIISAFDFESDFTKTIKETIELSGPDEGYNTRDFYYKKGTHKHKISIVQEHYSNWDGFLYDKDHGDFYVQEPAIKSYSVDSNEY